MIHEKLKEMLGDSWRKECLLYSKSNNYFHYDILREYVLHGILFPNNDWRIISPLFDTLEELQKWELKNRKSIEEITGRDPFEPLTFRFPGDKNVYTL